MLRHYLATLEGCNSCNRWDVWSNGTTCVPKSVPRFVLDKVRQVSKSEVHYSNILVLKVPNKSLSQECNNVLFCGCCSEDEQML